MDFRLSKTFHSLPGIVATKPCYGGGLLIIDRARLKISSFVHQLAYGVSKRTDDVDYVEMEVACIGWKLQRELIQVGSGLSNIVKFGSQICDIPIKSLRGVNTIMGMFWDDGGGLREVADRFFMQHGENLADKLGVEGERDNQPLYGDFQDQAIL